MTRGQTGHRSGAAKRTVTREGLEAARAEVRALLPSAERSHRLKALRSQISKLDGRSERVI